MSPCEPEWAPGGGGPAAPERTTRSGFLVGAVAAAVVLGTVSSVLPGSVSAVSSPPAPTCAVVARTTLCER